MSTPGPAVAHEAATSPAAGAFDYSGLPHDVASSAYKAADVILHLHGLAQRSILSIGWHLNRVKASLDHGQFRSWVEAEFPFTLRTAEKYMAASAVFDSESELGSILPPATMYALAAKSTPPALRESIIERLEAGEKIAPKEIAGMVRQARRQDTAAAAAPITRADPSPVHCCGDLEAERALEGAEMILRVIGETAWHLAAALIAKHDYPEHLLDILQRRIEERIFECRCARKQIGAPRRPKGGT